MKAKTVKATAVASIATTLALFTLGATADPDVQVKVTGQNDALVDRAAIQAAIDSAPGQPLIIKLRGTFQLDGQDILIDRSDITLKGDGSGTVIKGLVDANGDPVNDIENFPNRGILIEPGALVSNVEIRDLAISGCRTGVFGRAIEAPLRDLTVKDVQVENCLNGLVVIGDAQDVTLANNVLRDTGAGVILRDAEGTVLAGVRVTDNLVEDENAAGVVIERFGDGVSDILVANNRVLDSIEAALWIASTDQVSVVGNYLATTDGYDLPFPIMTFGANSELSIEANVFDGGAAAALFTGNATNATISRNCFRNGGSQGFPIYASGGVRVGLGRGYPGSGFDIADNSYENSIGGPGPASLDVWLTPSASNNVVLERASAVVLDEGTGNSVGVLAEDGVDHCDGA